MERKKLMIHLKQILFLRKKTGVLLILFIILIAGINNCYAEESSLKPSDIRNLAIKFKDTDQLFLSYIYNFAFYRLTSNNEEKLNAGLDALDACLLTNHFSEAEKLIFTLGKDFPDINNY